MGRIIALVNQKGGVGKTTTAVNLGAALAVAGKRVLVIDTDPQGNATTGLGINKANLTRDIYHVLLHEVPLEQVVTPTDVPELSICARNDQPGGRRRSSWWRRFRVRPDCARRWHPSPRGTTSS